MFSKSIKVALALITLQLPLSLQTYSHSADSQYFYFLTHITHIHIFPSHETFCLHSQQDSDSLEGDSSLIKLTLYTVNTHLACWSLALIFLLVSSQASQYWHCLYPESGDRTSSEWIFWQVATLWCLARLPQQSVNYHVTLSLHRSSISVSSSVQCCRT